MARFTLPLFALSLSLAACGRGNVETSAPASFALRHSLALADFQGQTFFQAMTGPGGIKDHMDQDFKGEFKVAGRDAVFTHARNLDPAVHKKVVSFFKDGEAGLGALVDQLAGKTTTPEKIRALIGHTLETSGLIKQASQIGLATVTIAPYICLTSGAGTAVELDTNNRYLNIGYAPGSDDAEQLAKDVKTGRSFGVSAKHAALDASDRFYLGELDDYLQGAEDASAFYGALMHVLTQADVSALAALPEDSQAVATDFTAVYTAELDRHVMAKLKTHPWENDLAEATIVSAYVVKSGQMFKNKELAAGKPEDFFGLGKTGSGIGITRQDRYALQKAVAKAERELHPDTVAKLERLTGTRAGGDVVHGVMLYLNNYGTQDKVQANADELSQAVAEFTAEIQADAPEITRIIRKG